MSQPAGQALLRRRWAGSATPRSEPGAAGDQYRPAGRAFHLRVALALGRAEARLLVRSLLVLAGLLAGGAVALHYMSEGAVPLWWAASWQVGYGQMFLSTTVLAAAQLAAGRARRAGMDDLYEGLPVAASTRTAGHLFSLVGALPASLLLLGATSALAEWHGAIGSPGPIALGAGGLLVVTGGAIGVALGARFPHPLVGVLGALVWIAPFSQSNRFAGSGTWLWPWVMPYQLGQFPAPLAGYPPAAAHALYLAGTAGFAMAVALLWRARTGLGRGVLLVSAALAIALACTAAVDMYQPVPTADINRLVSDVAVPPSGQHCESGKGARYCVYPGFGPVLSSVEGPVAAVISRIPATPAQPLTVEQTANLSLDDASLTHGHPKAQLSVWAAALADVPSARARSSAVYLPVSAWPTNKLAAPTARFDLALATAEWALGLPTSTGSSTATQCVPVDQAREPIAIWLAAVATHTQVGNNLGADMFPVRAAQSLVMAWPYPGEYAGYLGSPGPQTTAAGYLVAEEMTALPAQRVTQVVDGAWAKWANGHTTDSQLAASLGVAVPAVPSPALRAPTGQAVVLPQSQPVCTP